MQKTGICYTAGRFWGAGKPSIRLIMRISFFILFSVILTAQVFSAAPSYGQGNEQKKISLDFKNTPLRKVFSDIEAKAGVVIMYENTAALRDEKININVKDQKVADILDALLKGKALKWNIRENIIRVESSVPSDKPDVLFRSPSLFLFIEQPPLIIKVLDTTGAAIAGVSVSVKGSKKAGTTNASGILNLDLSEGEVLVISYVGMETQNVRISQSIINNATLQITLRRKVAELVEVAVVNTGYQRIRPEQTTGAVSTIGTKEYESRISTNFLDGLVNRLPGLMINNNVQFTSTVPGVGQTSNNLFNIRGISTMSANQSPLIVVDGYPTELTINMIDPNEIKSVTILKDAAAATVYGVRASNGVIVIERKQAAQGKAQFSFNATFGFRPKENYDRYRWADNASTIVTNYQKERTSITPTSWELFQTGTPTTGGTVSRSKVAYILAQAAAGMITPDQAAKAYADLSAYNNIDDYNRLFQRTALTQTYNMNVSGGTANALYYLTGNYTKNSLNSIKNDNNRMQLSGRSLLKLSQRLNLELITDYQETRSNSAPVPGISGVAPYERFQDESGSPTHIYSSSISPYYNDVIVSRGLYDQLVYPLVDVNEINTKVRTVNNRFNANFRYDIAAGLNLSFGGIYETSSTDNSYLASEQSSLARRYVNTYVTINPDGTLKFNIPKGGYLNQQKYTTSSYTARAQLNYNKRIGKDHSVNGIIGGEVRNLINKGSVATYFGYNDGTLLLQPADLASISTGAIVGAFQLGSPLNNANQPFTNLYNQAYTEDRFLSGYANVVYSYRNTYSFSGSMRIDQSNLFGTNPKYKYKPLWSFGAAWNLNREQFMQDVHWVKVLKLRASYGFNGNVAKMSLPEVIAQVAINTYTSPSTIALSRFSYANSSLRWEQTKNINIGLDYSIFKNITGSIEYYQKKSTDLLSNAQIDPTIGASPSLINAATIMNKGVEFSLNADWISTRKVNWNTGLIVARNTSNVLQVYRTGDYNPQTLNVLGFVKDYPVGALFAYNYGGLDNTGFPTLYNNRGHVYTTTNPSSTTNPVAAAMRRTDTSGLARYMGSSVPTVNGGLSNRIDIGNFYFFCMINYYGGFKVRVPRINPADIRPVDGADKYWRAAGDEKNTDVMALAGFGPGNASAPYNYADKYVVNGDYITLGDLTVSYNFNKVKAIRNAGFSSFEVRLQASNVWTVGLNDYNYSMATGSYEKRYITPTYTIGIFTNF